MALSDQTVNRLAEALAPEIIEFIYEDERWVDFMMEIIPEAVAAKMGDLDIELLSDLSVCIMDRIYLKSMD